nr:DapH/DapD/GlmU-related protein [Musicola keenii]
MWAFGRVVGVWEKCGCQFLNHGEDVRGKSVNAVGRRALLGANAVIGILLGDACIVASGWALVARDRIPVVRQHCVAINAGTDQL